MRNLTACWLLFCLCLTVNARVETFRNREVEEGESLSNKIVFITAKDSIIGSDDPTFSADQKISLKSTSTNVQFTNNSILHILFFPVDVSVGMTDEEGVVQYCCTKELIEEGKCVDDGALIISDEDDKVPTIYREYLFTNATTEFVWKENWKINSSGSYNLLYINCKGSELGDVVIEGTITYINPFGQLSAESYPLLWFFGFMTFVIMITAAIWLVFIAYYRKSLLSLQHFISGVLLLELFESFIWFLMFWVANRTGEIHWGWITITVLTSSVKRTSVGLLYLLISLGYGIMNKSRIGNNKKMIIIVILFYFAVSTGQELITSYIREGVVSSDVEVFLGFAALVLLFPSVVIPLGLFWWICACLSKTIQKVKLRQQNAKLELYTKILITLIVACTVVLLMILMETGISIMDSDQSWRVWWLFTAFWFVVFFCLTGSLLVLLHPSKNPKWLVSYTASLSDEDDEYYTSGIELDDLEKDMEIDFDFDLGFDDIGEEETSKLS